MKIKTIIILLIILILLGSCNCPDCKNDNPIFDNFSPSSKVYKDELVKRLKAKDNKELCYWLKEYEEVNGQGYLKFDDRSDDLCAILVITVLSWDNKLKYVGATKGRSYVGAEFKNLKFNILQDSLNTFFIFKGFDYIID
tara:strand:+ start:807 stop:1226 length:420 start_codon:yes stop_codon:yes gene_type:complete